MRCCSRYTHFSIYGKEVPLCAFAHAKKKLQKCLLPKGGHGVRSSPPNGGPGWAEPGPAKSVK